MRKTALQTAISEFYKEDGHFGNDVRISRNKIVTFLRTLLPLDRENIEQAWGDGLNRHRDPDVENRQQYFDKHFEK